MRVLLVEDNDDDFALLRRRLPKAHCVQARDMTEAAELLLREKFSVCLLDVILGLRDGTDFLRVCREQRPPLPAIVITGSRDPVIEERAFRLGAADFLHKDQVEAAVLERVIERVMNPPLRETSRVSLTTAKRRLLVVDDEPLMLKAIDRALSKQHTLVLCNRGEAALAAFESAAQPFDLILSDLHMPTMSGLELFRQMRTMKPLACPFALMTAGAITLADEEDLRRSGLPHLRKPFSNGELRSFIDEHSRLG